MEGIIDALANLSGSRDEDNSAPTSGLPAPGMLAPVSVDLIDHDVEELPESIRKNLKLLVKNVGQGDAIPRRKEVKRAKQQRLYAQGIQRCYWDDGEGAWLEYEGDEEDDDESRQAYKGVLNQYSSKLRGIIAVLTQDLPAVRFTPTDSSKPVDIECAASFEKLRKVIEREADMESVVSTGVSRSFTDGRTLWLVESVADAAKYGYTIGPDGERQANAKEQCNAYGVLEHRLPLGSADQASMNWCQVVFEIPDSIAMGKFPQLIGKISGDNGDDNSEDGYERRARQVIATATGYYGTDSTTMKTSTWTRTWLRPAEFLTVKDEDERLALLEAFPLGVRVEHVGPKLVAAVPQNLDDVIVVMHPLPPQSGQASVSLGDPVVGIQDSINGIVSIREDVYEHSIPNQYADPEVFSPDAAREQPSLPGMRYPASAKEGQPLAESFYTEEVIQISPDAVSYFNDLTSRLMDSATAITPELFGLSTSANSTAAGQAASRDAALGQLRPIFQSLRRTYSKSIYLMARLAQKHRTSDVNASLPGKRGKVEDIRIPLESLKAGNCNAYIDNDQGFPQTWSSRRAVLFQLMGLGDAPAIQQVLTLPDNQAAIRDLIGLEELRIPGADSREKQLTEIDEMLDGAGPTSDLELAKAYSQAVMQAQASGQPIPPKPPIEAMFLPSVPIDEDFDDHSTEYTECLNWINSPEGQQAKRQDPEQFADIRFHALAHKAAMTRAAQAAAANAAPPPAPPKPPSVSLSYKDVVATNPTAAAALLAEAGLPVGPPAAQLPAPAVPASLGS